MLKGHKVDLRPVKRSDIANFMVWFNDPEVTQYLVIYLPMTEMAEEKWIESLAEDKTRANLIIEAIDSGPARAIGTTGFHNIDNKDRGAVFGIAIGDKDYWGQGYGAEAAALMIKYAFEQLNLNRVASEVYDFNQRSQRMHLKIGFRPEGRRREARFINGSYRDVLEYGLLRSEWAALRANNG